MSEQNTQPRFLVEPIDEAPWYEAMHQIHPGGRSVCVRQRVLEESERRIVLWTVYEPGLILRQHTHACDQITHLVEGEFHSGETLCKAPAVLVLEKGAAFGPVVAGPRGAVLLEIFLGPSALSTPTDQAGYHRLLEEKGVRLPPGAWQA